MEEYGLISVEIEGQVGQVQAFKRQNGFDAMTGEPVMEIVIRNGFDAMTGEPAYAAVEQNGFDAMTGVPVYKLVEDEESEPAKESSVNQIVETVKGDVVQIIDSAKEVVKDAGSASSGKAKALFSGKFPTAAIIGGIAALAVILVIVLASALGSKQIKILKAIRNTVADDTFGEVLMDSAKILSSDETTYEMSGSVYAYGTGGEVNGSLSTSMKDAQIGFNGSFDIAGVSQEANFYYDDSKIQFSLPNISSSVYEYDYTKKNTGALADIIEENTAGSIEDVNVLLSGAAKTMKKSSAYRKKSTKAILKALSDVKVKKTKSKEFEVNGKDRKCKGYKVIITEKDVRNISKAMSDAREKVYGDIIDEMMEAVENLTGERLPDMDDFESQIELDDDIEIEFFIYKKALAAVSVESEYGDILVEFLGGDNRTSNIIVSVDGNEIIERESEMSGKEEEGTIKVEGVKIKYSYNKSTGDLMINPGVKINANYKVKGNNIVLSMDENVFGVNADGTLTISKGSRAHALKGSKFDVGNADETDINGEIMEIVGSFDMY